MPNGRNRTGRNSAGLATGDVVMTLITGTIKWIVMHRVRTTTIEGFDGGGFYALPKILTTVRLAMTGSDDFSAGQVHLIIE